MKFAFIHAEKASFTISAMCRLFSVSRQGFYAYVKALRSPRLAEELALQAKIRTIHADVDRQIRESTHPRAAAAAGHQRR